MNFNTEIISLSILEVVLPLFMMHQEHKHNKIIISFNLEVSCAKHDVVARCLTFLPFMDPLVIVS